MVKNPFKKNQPAALPAQGPSAEEIKASVGYPEEDVTNLGETPAPFLPDQQMPRNMPAPQGAPQEEQQPPVQDIPDFLNPQPGQPLQPPAPPYPQPPAQQYQQEGQEYYQQPPEPESQSFDNTGETYEQNVEQPQAEPAYHAAQAADVHNIATVAVEGLRQELQLKMDSLNNEISNLKKLENSMMQMTETLSQVEKKYEKLSTKSTQLPEKTETEIQDIKSSVDSMSMMLSKALPALIKEIRSMK